MYKMYEPKMGWISTVICLARLMVCFLRTSESGEVMKARRYAHRRNCQYLSRRDNFGNGSWRDGMELPSTSF